MIFFQMILWASKDKWETRIFNNGLKEELISWLTVKDNYGGLSMVQEEILKKKVNHQVYQLDLKIQYFDEQQKEMFVD